MPDDLVIQISRRFGSDIWTLDLLLQYMNNEIQACENCVSLLKVSSHSHQEKSTAFNLNVSTERDDERKCVFCLKEGHSPSQCRKVTNMKSRVDILMKKRRCFVCLRSGHQKGIVPRSLFVRIVMVDITSLFVMGNLKVNKVKRL